MSFNFGNQSFHDDEHMLHSLPVGMQLMGNTGAADENTILPVNTQNYQERYKDLENILADEKRNNEEIKQCYKVLKNDHGRQKNDCLDLKAQMTSLIEENKMMQEKYKSMFDKMQQESRRKQIVIEELKNKELDDIKLERIKDDLSQQIEAPYKDIVKQLEQELQKLQQEFNKGSYQIDFLKQVNTHETQDHATHMDQLKMKHDVEMNALKKDRDLLREKLQEMNMVEINRMKEVVRESNQLKVKVRTFIEENDELREKIEHIDSQNASLIRNHSKALSEYTTKIAILESEKDSLKQQADNSYKEMMNLNELSAVNTRKLHDAEREVSKLKIVLDEEQHNNKKIAGNLKLEWVKQKGEESRAKELLNQKIEDLTLKIEVANESVEMQKRLLDEKERELTRTMNTVNEENWAKISELTNEKIDLESKVQILTKDAEFKLNAIQIEKDKSDDRLNAFQRQREEVIKENNHLRTLVLDSENLQAELQKEQDKNREMYKKFHKAEAELNTNTSMEQELTEANMRLKSQITFHVQEVQRAKEHVSRTKDDYETRFNEWKSQYMAEKNDLKFKCEDLESRLTRANSKYNEIQKFHEKKKKQYQSYSKTLKTKAEALNAKVRDYKSKDAYNSKRSVPIENYNKLKMQLTSIAKKHHLFRDMVLGGNLDMNVQQQLQKMPHFNSIMSLPSINFQSNENIDQNMSFHDMENETKPLDSNLMKTQMNKKFDEITNRLDFLATMQNEHLKDKKSSNNEIPLQSSISSKNVTPSKRTPSPKKDQSITSRSPPKKQIESKKLSLSTSTSSVESFSKKLEKSGMMSPEDEKLVINTSISEKPAVKKRENLGSSSQNIVLKKITFSSSSENDDSD